MFVNKQTQLSQEKYRKLLQMAASLSRLFSESEEPYLGYRLVENVFCRAFSAENLSRHDTSVDASKENIGIGVKTFLYKNGKSFEKVAEFNKELDLFVGLSGEKKVRKVSELRNERIRFAQRAYGLEEVIYHCVVRTVGKIQVYEVPMQIINTEHLEVFEKGNSVRFVDRNQWYNFNTSKSTLFQQFTLENVLMDFPVQIMTDPFQVLENLDQAKFLTAQGEKYPFVCLPLFSQEKEVKYVPEKSALNQWNAGGRVRGHEEVYIRIPSWIHQKFLNFFPDRETKFILNLPNKKFLQAKVCQDGGKALMSDPNADLGKWLLRDVLQLAEGELLTYAKLESLGIDSVIIHKLNKETFTIDFSKIGTYDEFFQKNHPESIKKARIPS